MRTAGRMDGWMDGWMDASKGVDVVIPLCTPVRVTGGLGTTEDYKMSLGVFDINFFFFFFFCLDALMP